VICLLSFIHTIRKSCYSYGRICQYLFDRVLAPFYAKSSDDKLPESELPREVYDALKSECLLFIRHDTLFFDWCANCFVLGRSARRSGLLFRAVFVIGSDFTGSACKEKEDRAYKLLASCISSPGSTAWIHHSIVFTQLPTQMAHQ